jgi:hypothetical protein
MAVQTSPIEESGKSRNNGAPEYERMTESRLMSATGNDKMRLAQFRTEKKGIQMPQI